MPYRNPAVAGTFYEDSQNALHDQVTRLLPATVEKTPAIAVLSPHAGLMYSGTVAGAVYASVSLPDTIILLGPNHTGRGPAISLFPEGTWHIPGADITIATPLANRLLALMPHITPDEKAHRDEHCLEVQLPFLSYLRKDIRIVPIILGTTNLELCQDLGECLAVLLKEVTTTSPTKSAPLIVATTDFNHYESETVTRRKDQIALEKIRMIDPVGLHQAVISHHISMCGLGPAIATLQVAKANHIKQGTLVRYATSGEVSGDLQRVVGYGGLIFSPHHP